MIFDAMIFQKKKKKKNQTINLRHIKMKSEPSNFEKERIFRSNI